MLKIDLHSHSIASPDGSLTATDYRHMLESGRLDAIAVTDHDTTDFALTLHRELVNRIIVGNLATRMGVRLAAPAGRKNQRA